jgi:hypothetical protein
MLAKSADMIKKYSLKIIYIYVLKNAGFVADLEFIEK